MKKLIIAVTMLLSLPVNAAAPLDAYKEYRGNASILRATAITGNVVIKEIILNQGGCSAGKVRLNRVEMMRYPNGRQMTLPYTMKMGEKRIFSTDEACNIIEATVRTNHGDWTWNF